MQPATILQHAALGALVSGGGIAALQSLLARELKAPSSFALSLGSFVGTVARRFCLESQRELY